MSASGSGEPPKHLDREAPSRAALRRARRVCVKAGTSVVAHENGRPSLTRLGALAEQVGDLVNQGGVEVILVSSGAVGMGKRLLRRQSKMLMSLKDIQQQHHHQPSSTLSTATAMMSSDSAHDSRSNPGGATNASSGGRVQRTNSSSFVSLLEASQRPHTLKEKKKVYDSACAAAGQFEMMNLYNSLFAQCDVSASQILVTQADFKDAARLENLQYAIDRLLSLGIVPIINENDAVSANQGYTADDVFSDNDSLAALCARHFGAEVLLLLTDVKGVYDRPPTDPASKLIPFYHPSIFKSNPIAIGAKSALGRGGMASKIDAANMAVSPGSRCSACVVAAGHDLDCIRAVLGSEPMHLPQTTTTTTTTSTNSSSSSITITTQMVEPPRGTLFCTPGSDLEAQAMKDFVFNQDSQQIGEKDGMSSTPPVVHAEDQQQQQTEAETMAQRARAEARKLLGLPYTVRQDILRAIATSLVQCQDELLAANLLDLQAAEENGVEQVLKKRLKLTPEKIATLASGLNQIADLPDPLHVVKSKRELSPGLVLSQITVPIGVLLIIFESRPDSMPQISALALASGNGLLLKGGKEAMHSNAAIHKVIGDAIETASNHKIQRDIIGLITTRSQIADLLRLDHVIDLVIPRGSNELVSYIKAHTKIPVLGHADGVCHMYVDKTATATAASQLAVDAKTDYPSACNAMETLLLHEDCIDTGVSAATLMALRASGVKCLGGPRALKRGLCDLPATALKHEYGDLTCLVELVPDVHAAIDWIHQYGSGHTECIVCTSSNNKEDEEDVGELFLQRVDAACVFVNASTRFADGYRFGLGAEVGISTGRIHARGPVGVEGLLTTKWQLRSTDASGTATHHCVSDFAGDPPRKTYTHKELL